MVKIEIDMEVFEKLKGLSIPFVDLTPNHIIRRLLGMSPALGVELVNGGSLVVDVSSREPSRKSTIASSTLPVSFEANAIDILHKETSYVKPVFLTILVDKYLKTKGNYKPSEIISFMEKFNLTTHKGLYRNPWMHKPYKNKKSCHETIYHFNQCRKFSCWNNKDVKLNCNMLSCDYHPDNKNSRIKNKCDLRKGVIWKKENPEMPFSYGNMYLTVIKNEVLNGKLIQLELLTNIFYPKCQFNDKLIDRFKDDFNLSNEVIDLLFTY